MKAMIFAAGLGTRLKPLTDNKPKALVDVAGKPMLERVITNLIKYGFNEIVINVHHFGEQIIDFVNSKNFNATIHISDERGELLDTGGGILKAEKLLISEGPFLVHNADILTDLNLADFYKFHCNNNADASILVASRETARYFLFDEENRLCGWINKKTGEKLPNNLNCIGLKELAFVGIHVMSPSIFKYLREFTSEHKFSITPFYVNTCQSLRIYGYNHKESYSWFDVGKIETLKKATDFITDDK